MIQIQLIQVEMSTTMRGDLHALLTSTALHFPFVDVFGVQAGIRANYHRAQQTTVLEKVGIPG